MDDPIVPPRPAAASSKWTLAAAEGSSDLELATAASRGKCCFRPTATHRGGSLRLGLGTRETEEISTLCLREKPHEFTVFPTQSRITGLLITFFGIICTHPLPLWWKPVCNVNVTIVPLYPKTYGAVAIIPVLLLIKWLLKTICLKFFRCFSCPWCMSHCRPAVEFLWFNYLK